MIEILSTGAGNSVQDLGRPLYLDQGIGRGGVMDRPALMVANMLAANPVGAAALEVGLMPFRLRFLAPARFAVAGATADIRLNDIMIPSFWSTCAATGDELRIGPPVSGARLVIAFSGGIAVDPVLGSSSTDLKSGFGGFEGRALGRGDRLRLGDVPLPECRAPDGFGIDPSLLRPQTGASPGTQALDIRVMAGAELDEFTAEAQSDLLGGEWRVSQEANRQGMRLEGPVLAMTRKRELLSHGIMPGTVQVPPSGQPIVQLAEANTCGGYPKIANVIEPDLWKLGQSPTGARIRFILVSRETALAAIRDEASRLDQIARRIERLIRPARKSP